MIQFVAFAWIACALPPADQTPGPTLAEVDPSADGAVDVVDRASALVGAVEGTAGTAPDLANAPGAFYFQIDGQDIASQVDAAAGQRMFPTYVNVVTASLAVAAADLATVAVVAPPAAAIAFAGDGLLVEVSPWLWTAANVAVGPNGQSATLVLNVAWVGAGWLAEMRVTSSDGLYNDTLWFNGFLAADGSLGWWDLYANGAVAGVVEWVAAPDGSYEAGIASLTGDNNGDVLAYFGTADAEYAVTYWDASASFTSYVLLHPDQSGEVALLDWNYNNPGCWDTAYADVACP